MKALHIVGARPQFIKAWVISRALEVGGRHQQVLIHTGQHYDYAMSKIFFDELGLPEPDVNLEIGSGSHGAQTGAMLAALEQVLQSEMPDVVLVYGDTNSTLAGALAAAKLHLPVGHVEAGLRSFRRDMPEEINRIVADHVADFLFAPTETAVRHLSREGIEQGVHLVGDVMVDAMRTAEPLLERRDLLERLHLRPGEYGLLTIHRAANTDEGGRLRGLLDAVSELDRPVIFPVHPRTRLAMTRNGERPVPHNVRVIEPVGYLDMLVLEKNARCILTDSGGMQKEAYLLRVPCVTLREETEWVETLADGWNVLAGADADAILRGWQRPRPQAPVRDVFGRGDAGARIVSILDGIPARDGRRAATPAGSSDADRHQDPHRPARR